MEIQNCGDIGLNGANQRAMPLQGNLSFSAALAVPSLGFIVGAAALLLAAAASVGLALMLRVLLRSYLKHRGTRLITCPETRNCEAVRIDALHAAATGLLGPIQVNLKSCTRWPERQDCHQECIRQIELSQHGCRLPAMMASWYGARKCAYCERPFQQVHEFDHKAGLLSPKGEIVEWKDVPARSVLEILATHRPVCWHCMIAESFNKRYPDLAVDRSFPAQRDQDSQNVPV
jgi:hypothetical protein